jgi:hypothetical protein
VTDIPSRTFDDLTATAAIAVQASTTGAWGKPMIRSPSQ